MPTPKTSLKATQARPLRFAFTFDEDHNRLELSEDRDELKQAILLRLLAAKGDWFFDRDLGLPWITRREFGVFGILGSMPAVSPQLVEAFIRDELEKEARVTATRNYDITFNEGTRSLEVAFDVIPIDEAPFRIETVI